MKSSFKFLANFALATAVFLIAVSGFQAYSVNEKPVSDARSKTGEIVKCGPNSEGDVKSPGEALKVLKKGMVIHFMPGHYDKNITISQDNIIIEGEAGKFCDLDLTLTGKRSFVRNIWLTSLSSNQDLAVADSIINHYYVSNDARADIYFNNCCLRRFHVGCYNKRIFLDKCTICGLDSVFHINGSQITIENSVIYSLENVMYFTNYNRVKLVISDSLIYGGNLLATGNDEKTIVSEIKDMKNLCSFTKKGNVVTEKPVFEAELQKPAGYNKTSHHIYSSSYSSSSSYYIVNCREYENLMTFVLKDQSPGKKEGFGANLDEKGVPIPPTKK